jgi:hypothetical protein
VQTILKGFNKPMKKKAEGSTCRFPINWSKENKSGCIKTAQQKVICLIQVQLGSIDTSTFAFSMTAEVDRIFKDGQRIAKFLLEILLQVRSCSYLRRAR